MSKTIKYHSNIAAYFKSKPLINTGLTMSHRNIRKTTEVLWQYNYLKDWNNLKEQISDLQLFNTAWQLDRNDTIKILKRITDNLRLYLRNIFPSNISESEKINKTDYINLAELYYLFGNNYDAQNILKPLTGILLNTPDDKNLLKVIDLMGKTHLSLGYHALAMEAFEYKLLYSEKQKDDLNIAFCYEDMAKININLGKYEKAMVQLQIAENILLKNYRQELVARILILQIKVKLKVGINEREIKNSFDRITNLSVNINSPDIGIPYYQMQGEMYLNENKVNQALEVLDKCEILCENFGDKENLQFCFGSQTRALMALKSWDQALIKSKKQEEICYDISSDMGLQATRADQAVICINLGNYDEALRLTNIQINICRKIRNNEGIIEGLFRKKEILNQGYGNALEIDKVEIELQEILKKSKNTNIL